MKISRQIKSVPKSMVIAILLFVSCEKEKPISYNLYLLIGQSNMAGRGNVSGIDTVTHERVWMLDKQNQWVLAKEPVHFDKPERIGVGPGLAFGKAMTASNGAKIGLIPCAVGGTKIEMWKPGGFYKKTGVHPYDDALKRAKMALGAGTLKGILWHQGEYDSTPKLVPLYKERLKELAERLRKELNAPDVPFVVGGLGDFYIGKKPEAERITEILSKVPQYIENTGFVAATALAIKEIACILVLRHQEY